MRKTITYAIDEVTGDVYSRVGSEVAVPVLDYATFGLNGDFSGPFSRYLEKMSVFALAGEQWSRLKWTRKVPAEIKNVHREFWGMDPLKE
jgi:hypothetical protein